MEETHINIKNQYSETFKPTMVEQDISGESVYSNHYPMMFQPPPPPHISPLALSIRKKQLKLLESIIHWKDKKEMKKLSKYPPPFLLPHPSLPPPPSSFYYHHYPIYYLNQSFPSPPSIPIFYHPLYSYPNEPYLFENNDKTQLMNEEEENDHVQIISIPSSPNTFHSNDSFPSYIVTQPYNDNTYTFEK